MTAKVISRFAVFAGLWAALVVTAVVARPLLPVDETRYLAVAWEMWQRGDFLVPYLNGAPYSHKPPLLFWGMHLGWALFGVNDWWPRLVAPLFGLLCLLGTWRLARLLWPELAGAGAAAVALTLGALYWTLFTTMTMFDMLHATFTLGGMVGLVTAARGRPWAGFAILAASIGLGVLGKGPAILVHLLPAALAAPVWAGGLGWLGGWARWYVGIALAVLAGAAIGLAWALPAGAAGGDAYRDAIFWGQSAGRMVDSFAHGRPFWWFAAILPGMLLPWTIWPAAWRALSRQWRGMATDSGVRLCLIWAGTAFFAFSAISGKQPHYLVPEFPALALIMSWAVMRAAAEADGFWRPADRWVPAVFFVAIAAAIAVSFHFDLKPSWATSAGDAELWPLILVLAAVLAYARFSGGKAPARTAAVAGLSAAMVVVVHLVLHPLMAESHDFGEFSRDLKRLEDQGAEFVTFGKYHGQFHFMGRLTRPVAVVDGPAELDAWLAKRPKAMVIALHKGLPAGAPPMAVTRFRSRLIGVWPADLYPPRVERLRP